MMRIKLDESATTMTVRVEGRFVGKYAEDARGVLLQRKLRPKLLVVNLSDVSFVDATGEEVLSWLAQIGGEFIAENAYSSYVCERLRLPLRRRPLADAQ